MSDDQEYAIINQNLTVLNPSKRECLPVPIAEWDRLMERIEKSSQPTDRLEAAAFAALGVGVSFLIAAITLPISTSFSEIVKQGANQAEVLKWFPVLAECIFALFAIAGILFYFLAMHWRKEKKALETEMGAWIVKDMQEFKDRHVPRLHDPKSVNAVA